MMQPQKYTRYAHVVWHAGLFLVLSIALFGCQITQNEDTSPSPITVQLSWLHYASFGGLYAADQNNYYAEQGLDVAFLEGGPSIDHLGAVLNGQAQFGVIGGDELILARAQGKPVRAIAVILRHSPAVFVAAKDTGITKPEHFVGKTIRVTPQLQPTLRTIMARVGVQPDQYETVVLPSELTLFADGAADVWSVYFNSFAVELQAAGHEIYFIFPDDYGIHFYSDTIFTTDAVIEQNPQLVEQFLRATLRGLHYAIENPDNIGRMVTLYNPAADAAIETQKAIASIPLIVSGSAFVGDMSPDVWTAMYDVLLSQHVLGAPFDVTQVYTREFLISIFGDTDESTN